MTQKIKLDCGYTVEINDKILTDYRFLKTGANIQKATKNNTIGEKLYLLTDFIDIIFGEKQAEDLEEYLADKDGFLDATKLYETANEALEKLEVNNEKK